MEEIKKEKIENDTIMPAASLVFGVESIILNAFWYITLPAGILAIVFGIKSVKRNGNKLGRAGVITGIIGLSIFAFLYITVIILLTLAYN